MSSHNVPFGIVCCDVLELEVRRLVHHLHLQPLAQRFYDMSLHDKPESLHELLQAAISELENLGCERLLLILGLCGNAIGGLRSVMAEIILPRAHDCVTLYLGSKERYATLQKLDPGTYWVTPGWARGKRIPTPDYFESIRQQYHDKYPDDVVDDLVEASRDQWSQYTTLAFTHLGDGEVQEALAEARTAAAYLGMEFKEYLGDEGLLRQLLTGPWDDSEFLVVPAGAEIALSATEDIIQCLLCQTGSPAAVANCKSPNC